MKNRIKTINTMMKRTIIFLLGILASSGCFAQITSFKADERFELTSIAARLAGYQEYMQGSVQSYNAAIDSYFARYKEHGLIGFLKQMRQENHIGYDAIPQAAQTLVIKDGTVSVSEDADIAKLCETDPRWTEDNYRRFVWLLDEFYRQTDFHSFFEDNASLYAKGEEIMLKMCPVDTAWFGGFFGRDMSETGLCLAFVNGPNSYLMSDTGVIDGTVLVYGLFFDPSFVDPGQIGSQTAGIYGPGAISSLCGVMVAPIAEKYEDDFKEAADIFFNQYDINNLMRYKGVKEPDRMVYDWLQLLCTAMYFKDKGLYCPEDYGFGKRDEAFEYNSTIASSARNGCFWLDSSIEKMREFYSDRERYRDFGDFMPELAEYFSDAAKNIKRERKHYASLYPKVVSAKVKKNYSPDTLLVEFGFSVPMHTGVNGTGNYPYDDGTLMIEPSKPYDKTVYYSDDARKLTMKIEKSSLEKGRSYGFALPWRYYRSYKGYPMKGDYVFVFKY